MDKPVVRISVRNLVEFILRSGDLDNRGGSSDREAMQKGSRLHRKIQGRMGSHYRAEVSLKYKTEYEAKKQFLRWNNCNLDVPESGASIWEVMKCSYKTKQ